MYDPPVCAEIILRCTWIDLGVAPRNAFWAGIPLSQFNNTLLTPTPYEPRSKRGNRNDASFSSACKAFEEKMKKKSDEIEREIGKEISVDTKFLDYVGKLMEEIPKERKIILHMKILDLVQNEINKNI